MTKSNINEWWFGPLFRIAGYALLTLSFFDIVDIFVPSRFLDPAWEFQMVRNLVERAPVPLLGLVLVFCGEKSSRILRFLSWAGLVVSVLFFLLIPLGISSSVRLSQQLQTTAQANQQITQIQQLRSVLNKATTPQQINSILSRLNPQGRPPTSGDPQQLKSRLLSELAQAENKLKTQSTANQANARLALIKNTLKSILGALVSGLVFLAIWRKTSKMMRTKSIG